MYKYSKTSLDRLKTCHPDLQTLFHEVLDYFDHLVIYGHRGEEEQNKAFREGKSKLKFPQSKHNKTPSMAIDVSPFEMVKSKDLSGKLITQIDWNDRERLCYFAGFVMCMAKKLREEGRISHGVRWGGDWNDDTHLKDNKFDDYFHFELV